VNLSDYGSLVFAVIFFALVYAIIRFNSYQAKKAAAAKSEAIAENDVEMNESVLSFSAKRDDFDPLQAGSAGASQIVATETREAAPRGATRVRPAGIDYSIYDEPTYFRRGHQLSF